MNAALGFTTGGGASAPRRRAVLTPRPRATFIVWLVCAVVVGASVGRVVFFAPPSTTGAGTPQLIAAGDSSAAAVTALEQRVADTPTDVRALQVLGASYVRRATHTADPTYYDLAQRAFDRADVVRPGLDDTQLGRGLLALSRHDFAAALDFGTRVHAHNPQNPDALAVTVDAQVELGRYDEASASLQQLLDLHPGLPAYARLSYVRELHGDVVGAMRAMRQADIAANGLADDRATVATFLGDLELVRGRVSAADDEYRAALRLQPDLALARLGAARVAAVQGRRQAAIRSLQHLVRERPVPSAIALLGDLQALDGDTAAARRSFDLVRTIGRLQQSSGQVIDLEMAVFEADHADGPVAAARAVELARRAYDARPDNVFVNDALAWALFRSGDRVGALPFVDRALRLGTPDTLLHYHAATVFAAAGADERARAEIRTVLRGNPAFSFRYADDARALARRLGVES
jgi:predicted Zn-dependent protease